MILLNDPPPGVDYDAATKAHEHENEERFPRRKSMHLYEHADAIRDVGDWIEDHADEIDAVTGEIHPGLADRLDQIEGEFDTKVENVALFMREQGVKAAAIMKEADRLRALSQSYARQERSLKGYLLHCMRRAGKTKVTGEKITISLCKSSRPSVKPAGGVIPRRWEKIETRFDVAQAYADIKSTIPPEPGTYEILGLTVNVGQHVRIR